MTNISRIVLALLIATALHISAAESIAATDDYQQLDRFMRGLQTLEAEFTQTLQDSHGQVVEKSSGTLAIQRPDRFRWDYRQPNQQLIVSDGQRLWLYDKDLEQVTVRRLEQNLVGTPAMLLSGTADLRESFIVEKVEQSKGWSWIDLAPKRTDTDFKHVRLGLREDELGYMELSDKLGQTTLLAFSKFKRNPKLPAERFSFTPPAGVDVIGDAAAK